MFRHMLRCYATDSMAPGGIEPPHAASKAAALSAELRGRAAKGYPGPRLATLCRLGGGSSVGRAPGCGPGGRGFESRPPPSEQAHKAKPRTVTDTTTIAPSSIGQAKFVEFGNGSGATSGSSFIPGGTY